MRSVVVLAALAVAATASPFRLWAPSTAATTTTSTKASSAKDKAASHPFEQNKQYQNKNQNHGHGHGQDRYYSHHYSHHRVPLHGNDYGYSYRFQRSSSNPDKAVVYAPGQVAVKEAATPDKTTHSSHTMHNTHSALTKAPQSPAPDEAATNARFDLFAHAFIVTKNITEAFTYISEGYINHNPAAKTGATSAWKIFSPIWASQSITGLRTTFKGNMGWLNYKAGGLGEVVD